MMADRSAPLALPISGFRGRLPSQMIMQSGRRKGPKMTHGVVGLARGVAIALACGLLLGGAPNTTAEDVERSTALHFRVRGPAYGSDTIRSSLATNPSPFPGPANESRIRVGDLYLRFQPRVPNGSGSYRVGNSGIQVTFQINKSSGEQSCYGPWTYSFMTVRESSTDDAGNIERMNASL